MTIDDQAKRVLLWVSSFIAVATALGFVNKWLIADPIVAAVTDERKARIAADESLTDKISEIAERQAMFVGAAISVPGSPEWRRAEKYLRDNADRVPVR